MSGRPRVTKHFGALYGVVRSAAKRYLCSGLTSERHWIEPGQPYVASALPPDDPIICNDRWMHHRLCMDCCPAEYAEASR